MFNINDVAAFFGWCTVLNISILLFSTLFIMVFNSFAITIHSKLLDIDPLELPKLYFNYLANYKLGILIFNLAPYIALKLMQNS